MIGFLEEEGCAINQIHTDDAQRVLLLKALGIVQASVNDDLGGFGPGLVLESDPHPAMGVRRSEVAFGGHRIGKSKETGFGTAMFIKAFDQESELVIEHGGQAFPAHVALSIAIDGIAELHIVGGDGLGDAPGGPPDSKEPPSDFLTGPDLGKGAVYRLVEIEAECLLGSVE